MTAISKSQDAPKSQAELLYDAQLRKERHFRANVGLSWGILLLILVFLFSGQEITIGSQTFSTIKIDTQFILNEIDFIAGGLGSGGLEHQGQSLGARGRGGAGLCGPSPADGAIGGH